MQQRAKVLFLGLPILILVAAGMAITAFLSVNLLIEGVQDFSIGKILVGGIVAFLWAMMGWKTLRGTKGKAKAR